ncbi:MAG: release factor glutamine methyltransferase [Arenicella sp.]|jgi:release factor glutamine methyltransferase
MPKEPSAQSYRSLLDDATLILYDGSPTPRIDSEVLLQEVTNRPLSWVFAYGETLATADHVRRFFDLVAQRQQGQPIAYLLGYKDFWTLRLKVDMRVLIPRSDTETLIENALQKLPEGALSRVLDLGTGSGAIALSIAKERPNAQVVATDYQFDALEVAKNNATYNGVSNVTFLQSDWFSNIAVDDKFDLIASNPPYVEIGDPHLAQGDLRFEPDSALISGGDGLHDLEKVIQGSVNHLLPSAWLIVEHGYNQSRDVAQLLACAGYINIELHKDINDLPRCTIGQYPANSTSILT